MSTYSYGVSAGWFVCCSLHRLLYYLCSFSLFSLPPPALSYPFLHRLSPRCCQLDWGTQLCTALHASIIKKIMISFSVGVRWNHYLRFCALNVEGNPISRDFLHAQVHYLICCPSCRPCCFVAALPLNEELKGFLCISFKNLFTLLNLYFRGNSRAPCSILPLNPPWPRCFLLFLWWFSAGNFLCSTMVLPTYGSCKNQKGLLHQDGKAWGKQIWWMSWWIGMVHSVKIDHKCVKVSRAALQKNK